MSFTQLFAPPQNIQPVTVKTKIKRASDSRQTSKEVKPKKTVNKERGCAVCPLNEVEGLVKILPTIKGKELLVVAQSPGPEENQIGKELVGRSGKFFWGELKKVGIKREDVDCFNIVKCFPADLVQGSYSSRLQMRNPSAEEIRCCSIHTEEALQKSQARHILVLGQLAAKALLNTRSVPSQKVFYSEELKAKIYLVDHPAFFIRGGCTNETDSSQNSRLKAFRNLLHMLKGDLDKGETSVAEEFAYLKEQKYRLIKNKKQALQAKDILQKYARAGRKIAADVENYIDEAGNEVVTCCGFCPKPGLSFVFVFEHKDLEPAKGAEVFEVAKEILEDEENQLVFQWGCSDVLKLLQLGIDVRGYSFDTLYGGYFHNPDQKKYGLEEQVELHLPEFSGYKTIIYRDILENSNDVPQSVLAASTKVQRAYIKKHGLWDIRKLSLETLRLYNGADADVTKRFEQIFKKSGPAQLMKLYIDASFVLYQMEANGPLFNYEQNEKLGVLYPKKGEKLLKKIRDLLGEPEYNPASPLQVSKALYETLGLQYPGEGKPNTRKETLLVLAQQHEFPKLQLEVRRVQKANGTYIVGLKRCADLNKKRLRTRWKLTGTATGRLSSGGGLDSPGLTNLQNIPKDPQMRNMLVADLGWKEAYKFLEYLAETYYLHKDQKDPKKWRYANDLEYKQHLCQCVYDWLINKQPDLRTFLGFDFGQVEIRILAHACGDKNLIADCLSSDIHSAVGCSMTGWTAEQIKSSKTIRTLTKNIHFGIAYGQSEDGTVNYVMAVTPAEDRANISEEFIREGYRKYHQKYPGVRAFIEEKRAFVRENGYVETLFGLRRQMQVADGNEEESYEDENERSSYWGNRSVNTPIQGTAHQLMLCALVNLWRKKEKYAILGVPQLEIHDFLGFNIRVLDLIPCYKRAKHLLEKESLKTATADFGIEWTVPIVAEGEGGLRLGDQVDLHDDVRTQDKKLVIGDFLLRWYLKAKKNEEALDSELQNVLLN